MFSTEWLSFGEGREVRLKLDVQGQRGRRILDVDGQWGRGVLEIRQFSWTSYVYHPQAKCGNNFQYFVPVTANLTVLLIETAQNLL